MLGGSGVQVVADRKRTVLRDEYPRFIQAARDRGSEGAAEVYKIALSEFLTGGSRTYADELTREDVTEFHVAL